MTTIEATPADPAEPPPAPAPPTEAEPAKKRRGNTPEQMREMTRKRMEMAKLDPSKKGGRPRTKFSKREAERNALERMMPKALKVLEEQLNSNDERVRAAAAVKVLEYVKGKPTQQINSNISQVTAIVYESAAWEPGIALGGGDIFDAEGVEIEEADLLELPAHDEDGDPIGEAEG